MIDWLIIYSFTFPWFRSRIFHLYGDVTIAGEGMQKFLGLWSAFRAFEQGGIFIVPNIIPILVNKYGSVTIWDLGYINFAERIAN
jgi:hypothetical protein